VTEGNAPGARKLVGDRYAPLDEVREGGMSTVQKAFDLTGQRLCAIKRMKPSYDVMRNKESFNREREALDELGAHPNIVTLLVGRPILEALTYSQRRDWSHRDIKPSNILMADGDIAKVSDYGIAKQLTKPSLGATFFSFSSPPFAPPEDDSGGWRFSRDCFSLAAVSAFCMTGRIPKDHVDLTEMVRGFSHDEVPVDQLLAALSNPGKARTFSHFAGCILQAPDVVSAFAKRVSARG
jgi:serine/threonine protein kinase